MVSAGGAGAIALGVLYVLFPDCARGGYSALGPDMKSLWLVQISEARSLATLAGDNPGMAIGIAGLQPSPGLAPLPSICGAGQPRKAGSPPDFL